MEEDPELSERLPTPQPPTAAQPNEPIDPERCRNRWHYSQALVPLLTAIQLLWSCSFPSLRVEVIITFPQPYNERQAYRLLFEHHWREHRITFPPHLLDLGFFFLACLYLHVSASLGIMHIQGNYGHFKPNTGAKQRQVLENSLQHVTDGITAAKTTHGFKAVVVLRAQASQ